MFRMVLSKAKGVLDHAIDVPAAGRVPARPLAARTSIGTFTLAEQRDQADYYASTAHGPVALREARVPGCATTDVRSMLPGETLPRIAGSLLPGIVFVDVHGRLGRLGRLRDRGLWRLGDRSRFGRGG